MSAPDEIRAVREEDAGAIAAQQLASWPIEFDGIAPTERLRGLDPERRTAMIGRFIAAAGEQTDPASGWLVAVERGEVRGEVRFGRATDVGEDEATGEIGVIGVHPDHWRRGVGTALLAAAETAMRSGGLEEVVLWVLEPNEGARAFYEACGYRPDGSRRPHEGGPPPLFGVEVAELRYRRALRAGG